MEILRLSHISKTFPGVRALQDISFDLKRGEVHCLCGENGAGKSTLIKILSGAYQPDEGGQIFFNGNEVSLTPPTALRMGIHTIYQEHIVFNHLNITENIFAGSEIARRGLVQRKEMRRQTENVLRYLKSDLNPDMRMSDVSYEAFCDPSGGPRVDAVVAAHDGSALPACSRAMYSAYQSGQFGSAAPMRFSCSPCAAAARRSAFASSVDDVNVVLSTSTRPGSR